MQDEAIEAAAKAAYIAHHMNGPDERALEEPNMGRGGYKTEVVIWRAVAKAALTAAMPHLQGWQPIETAPKDGTVILGYWDETYIETIQAGEDGEFYWSHDGDTWGKGGPTHWTPLPTPPEQDNA